MERRTSWLITFFTAAVIVSLAGFFNSYIRFFPAAGKFPFAIHIHFIAFVFWFALLLVQPLLVRRKNYRLHRKLGRLSYFIAPVLVITMLWLISNRFQREWPVFRSEASITLLAGILDTILFSGCYIIAMRSRHNVRWHVAFLIGATLVILNPGLSRLLNQVKPGIGLLAAVLLPFLIPLTIVLVEKIHYKRPVCKSPYMLFTGLWFMEVFLFMTLPKTGCWMQLVENLQSLRMP